MARKHDSTDDDHALFLSAIGDVRRLDEAPPPPSSPKPRPRARMAEQDDADARHTFRHALDASLLEAGDALAYRRDELPARAWQRLKRGELSAQEELDAMRPALDGNQIMEILGIGPGREVGQAYQHLLELRMDRGPMTEEDARAALIAW